MKTERNPTKTNLMFDMHMINTALLNLNFAIMYNDMSEENPQHYLKRLIERLNDVNFNDYINK